MVKRLRRPVLPKKLIQLLIISTALISGLNAQTEYPAGDFWSLNLGAGVNGILVEGVSFQLVIDPRLWLSPPLMVGSKVGINYSAEENSVGSDLGNILTFEGQVYLRWNFLRMGKNPEKETNIFLQGGLGLISAYRGREGKTLTSVTETRGSVLAEAALGVNVPLTSKWHLEAQAYGGYPHLYGVSLTGGYKFPLPKKTEYHVKEKTVVKTEYVEVIKMLPPNEIIKRIMISSVEFVLFGPDIGSYNIGIDNDARQLNELVLDYTAQTLKDNPTYRVRIEGHANPWTYDVSEADDLMALSNMRANMVAEQLRSKGVSDEQMVLISFGGTRTVTRETDWDIRNRNRRVEMIIIEIDTDF